MRVLWKLKDDERGATAVEYSLILALIFLSMAAGVQVFADSTTNMWNNVTETVAASTKEHAH